MVKNLGPHLVPNAKIFGSGLVPGTENSLVPAQILGPESLKVVLNLGPRLVPKAKIFGPGLVPKTRLGTKGPRKKNTGRADKPLHQSDCLLKKWIFFLQ